jgi:uncharacterized protein (DUF1778 family)
MSKTPPRRNKSIEKRAILTLTAHETKRFAKAILNPPSPGSVLRKAAREWRKQLGGH